MCPAITPTVQNSQSIQATVNGNTKNCLTEQIPHSSSCTLTCNTRYVTSGTTSVTCGDSAPKTPVGSWSGSLGTCVGKMNNALDDQRFLSYARLHCNTLSFRLHLLRNVYCTTDHSITVNCIIIIISEVMCPAITPTVQNSQSIQATVNGNTKNCLTEQIPHSSSCTLTCNTRYVTSGTTSVTCGDSAPKTPVGSWSGSLGTCVGKMNNAFDV